MPAVLGGLRVPEEPSARVPAEERGSGRDDVRLLVSWGTEVAHHVFREPTGLHEPQAPHLLMPEAIAGRAAPDRGHAEAPRHLSLWHESATYPSTTRRRALTLGIARATIGEIAGGSV
ncbi:hypothetical protein [Streptomyces enissocaesilis]|uniref:Uncharacterized protein n=1 Tax=Streptomyces enissocaesilis TaxID=332589 RepID=A0ABP6JAL5_9ACTN